MPVFKVNKSKLDSQDGFRKEAELFCQTIKEQGDLVLFEPKVGYLATFGVLLTEKGISYQLEFEPNKFS